MQSTVSRDLDFVEFESGNQSVINFVLCSKPILSKVGLVIEKIKRLSSGRSVKFLFILRSNNKVVHGVTHAFSIDDLKSWDSLFSH